MGMHFLLFLGIILFIAFIVIKSSNYAEFFFTIVAIMSVVALIIGFDALEKGRDLLSVGMIGVGMFAMLGIGIVMKLFYQKK